jgi:cyanophycinase
MHGHLVEKNLMGTLLLEGGAEFGGAMREPDLRAIELAGGPDVPIRIIPTAAAPDKNHLRAGNNGIRWFLSLGATDVEPVMLINEESANDFEIAGTLRAAKLIYILGGFTHYLGQTLKNSLAWDSVLDAHQDGTVIAGSSAGAMVLCEYYFDPGRGKVEKGLNLVPNACVLPHHNTFGKSWAGKLQMLLPNVTLLGIDEYTGMIREDTEWHVLGGGMVTVYRAGAVQVEVYENGQRFVLD